MPRRPVRVHRERSAQSAGKKHIDLKDKLEWVNGQYVRKLSVPELTDRLLPFLGKRGYSAYERGWLEKLVTRWKSPPRMSRPNAIATRAL